MSLFAFTLPCAAFFLSVHILIYKFLKKYIHNDSTLHALRVCFYIILPMIIQGIFTAFAAMFLAAGMIYAIYLICFAPFFILFCLIIPVVVMWIKERNPQYRITDKFVLKNKVLKKIMYFSYLWVYILYIGFSIILILTIFFNI